MALKRILHKNHSIEESDFLECPAPLFKEFKNNVENGMLLKLPSSDAMANVGVYGEDEDFDWNLQSISLSKDMKVKNVCLQLCEYSFPDTHVVQEYKFDNPGNTVILPSLNDVLSGKNDTGDVYRKCCWGDPVECKNEIFDFTPYIESLKKKMQSPDVKVMVLEDKVEKLQKRLNSLESKKKFRFGL